MVKMKTKQPRQFSRLDAGTLAGLSEHAVAVREVIEVFGVAQLFQSGPLDNLRVAPLKFFAPARRRGPRQFVVVAEWIEPAGQQRVRLVSRKKAALTKEKRACLVIEMTKHFRGTGASK